MSQHRQWTAVFLFFLLFAFPRTSSAGLWDVIIEMSGPQLVGGFSGCLLDLNGTFHRCSIAGVPVKKGKDGGLEFGWPTEPLTARTWLFLQGGTYFSTGLPPATEFEVGRVYMVSADPMFAFRSGVGKYHAVGASLNLIVSNDFRRVGNYGLKLQPIVWSMLGAEWDVTVRLYKNGFDAIEPPDDHAVLVKDDDFEAVFGFSASLRLF
jgi:hypothetical protein